MPAGDTIIPAIIPWNAYYIAYGSDTKLAYDTLLSVARNHPNVLNDPEPTVRFFLFGESSLDFELRVFIPHPDHLLETRHDLHMEIDRRFREANIEIAFPQRDIHIRDISKVVVENVMLQIVSHVVALYASLLQMIKADQYIRLIVVCPLLLYGSK